MTIYVATHKKTVLPRASWLVPLGLGGFSSDAVPLSDARSPTNDCISALNKHYCELTGLYWIWKNAHDDFKGLCHYRRYFTFVHYNAPAIQYPAFILLQDTANAFDHLCRAEQHQRLLSLVDAFDFVVPRPVIQVGTIAGEFIQAHGDAQWSTFTQACRDELGSDLRYFDYETRFHYGNMLIAKRPDFDRYCESMFRVVDRVYAEFGEIPDEPGVRYQPSRYPGYLAERYLGLYMHKTGIRHFETPAIWLDL
jgi:hypothetical protein